MVGKWRKNDVFLRDIYLGCTTIAWFALNKAVSADTMAIQAADAPFEIKTTGTKQGLYDDFLDEVTSGAYASDRTTIGHKGIKWMLTKDTSEMENYYDGDTEPDMSSITRLDSEKYGLKPGDHGTLKFTVVSKTSSDIDVSIVLKNTAYKAKFNTDNTKNMNIILLHISFSSIRETIIKSICSPLKVLTKTCLQMVKRKLRYTGCGLLL